MYKLKNVRKGCHDIWNAYMVQGAQFSDNDIPNCPTTAGSIPTSIITWTEAKSIYKREINHKSYEFQMEDFVCFYEDDYKFDGARGIWHDSVNALRVLRHFGGVITPDFSTYQDFPIPLKLYNTYRMRAFGYWLGRQGISVINNVRWGTAESYAYCFDGIDRNSVIAIGTVGGSPRNLKDRSRFEGGFQMLMEILQPRIIIVYGSDKYTCFEKLRTTSIQVIAYPGRTARAFQRRMRDEQR